MRGAKLSMRIGSVGALGAMALAMATHGADEGSATPSRALLPASGARSQPHGQARAQASRASGSSAGVCAAAAEAGSRGAAA